MKESILNINRLLKTCMKLIHYKGITEKIDQTLSYPSQPNIMTEQYVRRLRGVFTFRKQQFAGHHDSHSIWELVPPLRVNPQLLVLLWSWPSLQPIAHMIVETLTSLSQDFR